MVGLAGLPKLRGAGSETPSIDCEIFVNVPAAVTVTVAMIMINSKDDVVRFKVKPQVHVRQKLLKELLSFQRKFFPTFVIKKKCDRGIIGKKEKGLWNGRDPPIVIWGIYFQF